jgi:hypothetical protein
MPSSDGRDEAVYYPDLIVDTNVLLQLYSVHDLTAAYARADSESDSAFVHRRERTRDALLFALLCDSEGLATGSLRNEPIRQLTSNAPPEGQDFETVYTQLFIWFIRDHVLTNWVPGFIREIDDTAMRGDACDDEYLALARNNELPLITDEGNTEAGLREVTRNGKRNLRGRAHDAGISVFTPGEFWRVRGLDPVVASKSLLERFDRQRPKYVASRPFDDDGIDAALDTLRSLLVYLLSTED